MGKSFEKRLEGREGEVRQDVQALGWLAPMEKYGGKDTIAWSRYVTALFDGKVPPISTPVASCSRTELGDLILSTILRCLANQKAEIAQLKAELHNRDSMQLANIERQRFAGAELMSFLGGLEAGK